MDYQKSENFSRHSHRRWIDTGMDIPQMKPRVQHSNLTTLARDMLKLLDLQLQMIALDVRQCWQESKVLLAVLISGAVFAVGAIPVLLLGLSTVLSETFQQPVHWMQMGLGGGVMLASLLLIYASIRGLTKAGLALKRSQEEVRKNLEWARQVLNRDEED